MLGSLRAAFERRRQPNPSLWTEAVLESFRSGGARPRRRLNSLVGMIGDGVKSHLKTVAGSVLLVVGATGYAIYVVNRPPVVFIDRITIHASLAPFPYSDDVVRERVWREIETIQDQARTRFQRVALLPPRELPDFEIPATPFSVRTVARWVEWALGREPTAIRVVITRPIADFSKVSDPYLYEAEIRTNGADLPAETVESVTLNATKPSELIASVSREIVRRRSPYMLASYFESHGDNPHALELVDAIIAGTDVSAKKWAFNLKGIVLSNLQRFDLALQATEHAIQLDATFASAYNTKGIILHNQKKHPEALKAYEQALSLDPDNRSIRFNRANELADVERHDDALEEFDRLIQLPSGKAEAYFAKGRVLEDRGRDEEAVEAFDAAIKISPRYRDAHYEKGLVLIGMKRLDEAFAANEAALTIDPGFADAYVNRAGLYFLDKKYEEALIAADKAIALDGRLVEAHLSKVTILRALDKRTEAWASNDMAHSIEPDNAKVHVNYAAMYYAAQQFERALAASERAIELDSRSAGGHLQKGFALLSLTNREKESLDAFAKAASLSEDKHEAHFGRGRAYAAIGDFEACRDELRIAIEGDANRAEYHDLLAVCLASLGEKEQAERAERRARELQGGGL